MDLYIWGWGPDPDPDFILSVFTCGQINSWRRRQHLRRGVRRAVPRAAAAGRPRRARGTVVSALQDRLYHESPYAVLWYVNTLEAYRSDRWRGLPSRERGCGHVRPWSATGPSAAGDVVVRRRAASGR